MSFQQGLSGLAAAAKNLDVIGNNVANANTVGFKGSAAQFGDVFAASVSGADSGGSTQVGIGTTVNAVLPQFGQGNITVSQNPLDLAINGQGFFRISENGAISYTRNGQFSLNKDGYVVNPSGRFLTGYMADSSGVITTSTLSNLQLSAADLPPLASTKADFIVNLDARAGTLVPASFNLSDSTTYNSSSSSSFFDGLGNKHTLNVFFLKSAANTWQVYASSDGTQIGAGAVGTLNFNTDGTINTGSTTLPFNLSIPVTTGAPTPMAVALGLTNSTQFGSSFGVNQITQDGFASGKLSGYTVASDGIITSSYTNGQTRKQGQVVLASFTNQEGLASLGQNSYGETSSSGSPLIGTPNSGRFGVVQSGAVEESGVDLTAELVKMITAQRVYQANAQTIKTQDEVLQTMVNMR